MYLGMTTNFVQPIPVALRFGMSPEVGDGAKDENRKKHASNMPEGEDPRDPKERKSKSKQKREYRGRGQKGDGPPTP